ncbi:MAG: NUDIX domain-containing protein [Azospirillaceae bacterium]
MTTETGAPERLSPDRPADPDLAGLETELVWKGYFTFFRGRYRRRRRDGGWQEETREVLDRGHGAAILLHDPERDTVVLVRQFRFPAWWTGDDGHLLELPAGIVDPSDAHAEETIRREVAEETGLRVGPVTPLFRLYATPGANTEHISFFHASYRAADRIADGGGLATEGEDIEVVELPLDEALALLESGGIVDQKTAVMLLWARSRR